MAQHTWSALINCVQEMCLSRRVATLIATPHDMSLHPVAPFVIVYAPPIALAVFAFAALLRLRQWLASRRA